MYIKKQSTHNCEKWTKVSGTAAMRGRKVPRAAESSVHKFHSIVESELAILSGNKYDLAIYSWDSSKRNTSPGS